MYSFSPRRIINFLQDSASTSLLLYPCNVRLGDGVPGSHVLFHALGVAGCLARGERRAGLGDAAFEAVLV